MKDTIITPELDLGDFAARLKAARAANHWTQRELAIRAGLRVQDICRFEKARRAPRLHQVKPLAFVLHVSADHLLGLA